MLKRIKNLFTWGKNAYEKIYGLFREKSVIAVNVTDKLKDIVEKPETDAIADIVTAIIPGDVDDTIYHLLKKHIPIVAQKVAVAHGLLILTDKKSDVLSEVILNLSKTFPAIKTSFWITFSAELNIALADGKLSLWESISLTQRVFGEIKKK